MCIVFLCLLIGQNAPQELSDSTSGAFDGLGQRFRGVASPGLNNLTIDEWSSLCLSARSEANRERARSALSSIALQCYERQQPLTKRERALMVATARDLTKNKAEEFVGIGIFIFKALKEPSGKETLTGLIVSRNDKVRFPALEALESVVDESCIPSLVSAAKIDWQTQVRVIGILGSIGTNEARKQIEEWHTSRSSRPEVKAAAAATLDRMDIQKKRDESK